MCQNAPSAIRIFLPCAFFNSTCLNARFLLNTHPPPNHKCTFDVKCQLVTNTVQPQNLPPAILSLKKCYSTHQLLIGLYNTYYFSSNLSTVKSIYFANQISTNSIPKNFKNYFVPVVNVCVLFTCVPNCTFIGIRV